MTLTITTKNLAQLSNDEIATIVGLRNRGFAVTIFFPEELSAVNGATCDPRHIEDWMVETGWDAIYQTLGTPTLQLATADPLSTPLA
jgi:hypothetical protein